MKHTNSFDKFLEYEVNLNPTRIERIKDGITTVETFIKNNPVFKDHFIKVVPQGSYRQKTIIKPLDGDGDFDVDILLELKEFISWTAKQYLDALHNEFKNTDRYKNIVDRHGKNRCVTLDYADDFHIDIIPSIRTATGTVIMNRETDSFEPTDGDGYAQWFEGANSLSTNNFLIKVVRLTKYLRDREDIPIKSIMLTTILGGLVLNSDTRVLYSDLPTAFKVLFGRYDNYLQSHSSPFDVKNPVLPTESFARHWNQDNFNETKEKVHDLRIKIDEAYDTEGADESLELWQEIFGETFYLSDSDRGSVGKTTLSVSTLGQISIRDSGEMFLSDFHISENLNYTVNIDAKVTQDGFRPFSLRGAWQILRKKRGLDFIVKSCNVPNPYSVKWKIKNTGQEALDYNQLRGEIIDDLGYFTRHENTKYEGAHYVECYIIKDNVCVAKDRLDVPIGNY